MKTKSKITGASAMTATNPQLCRLYRDNLDVEDFSLMTDAWNVWLSEQPMGQPQKCSVQIPRAKFNKLIRWYIREQKFIRK